jgi:mono/diheme cytochrome c family protein
MHGEGHVVFDQPMTARIVAPNLTNAVRRYNDAQLAAVIRQGVLPGGRSVLVMPSEAFVALTDADLGRILAFLKSLPAVDGPGPSISLGPVGRIGLAVGKFKTASQLIAAAAPPPEATGEEAAFGRYLALTTCAECHGGDLHGASNPDFTSPGLAVVAAYSPKAFTELLRTGVALGGRTLPVMGPRARENLSYLTDAEITALYGYLHTTRW